MREQSMIAPGGTFQGGRLLNACRKSGRLMPLMTAGLTKQPGRTSTMTVKGSCHCGATQFIVAKRPETVTRCTCSFCTKRGALWAYQDQEDDFVLTTARDRVSTYQWGSYQVEHHHCPICGCGTWSRSPLWDREAGRSVPGKFRVQVNAWLLEDFDPAAQPIALIDGRTLW
jgi:hypothetical protein